MLLILVQNAANAFKAATIPKLYIPSIINTEQVFGQIKNGLVSGRLACTSSNPQVFRIISRPNYNNLKQSLNLASQLKVHIF